MKKEKILKNLISGFAGQLIVIVLGLIVPRILISGYGSDVNGLLSTIAQIFTYMALLEAGIGQAAKNMLYKPFQEKNTDAISEVATVARGYFRRITIIYAIGVVVLAVVLPLFIKTQVDPLTISIVVLLEGMSGVVTFFFVQTPSIIIGIDGKNYINNGINLVTRIFGYLAKILLATLGVNIVFLQLAFFMITVIKVLAYEIYFRKNYAWVSFSKNSSQKKLTDRNSYILTEICWVIFSSTDMIILSFFVSTQMSSVYGIYNMIYVNISILVNAMFSSVSYLLGYTYHENIAEYARVHDFFNSFFVGIITVAMSVCTILTVPFVKLYTSGITDVNYVYQSLPIMFCIIQLLSWSRYTSGQLTGIAGLAKQTSYISLLEALINLSLSIVLVKRWGMLGVTFATVVALPIKVIWCNYISDKKVMRRSGRKTILILGINYTFFALIAIVSRLIQPAINSYLLLFIWGLILSLVLGALNMGINCLINRECWTVFRRYVLKR